MTGTTPSLRDRLIAALDEDAIKPRDQRQGLVNAMLDVVQPELDRLREIEAIHHEMTTHVHSLTTCTHGHTTVHVAALARQIAEKCAALHQRAEACREVDRLRAELATARNRALTEAAEMLATDTTVMNEPGDQYALAYAEVLLAARDTTS